jgi:NRPS condensation-like uncharacterized protein
MNKDRRFWIPLDNAAKIFPAIRSKEHSTVLRISVVLKKRVVIKSLLKAIDLSGKRFPYFKVALKKGFFWYYLEQVDHPVIPQVDNDRPCRSFTNKKNNELMFRILAYKNRISVEFSHILTDGYGASQFLNAILYYYFRDQEIIQSDKTNVFFDKKADRKEYEDAYNRFFKENIPPVVSQPKAYHLPFPLTTKPRFNVLLAILSVKELKCKAKEKEVSITDYLVAVYLWVLQSIINESEIKRNNTMNGIIRIQVPVNLRNIYPSKTMRNFTLFVIPEIDLRLGSYSFDEILKIVYHKMQLETDEKLINKVISRNVGSERKLLVRTIPLLIKSFILYFKYYSEGVNQYSGVITNLGKITPISEISNKIDYFTLTPPPPNRKLKINCGVIGFQDKLVLSFGNITKSREFERRYLSFLVQQGIKVKITDY